MASPKIVIENADIRNVASMLATQGIGKKYALNPTLFEAITAIESGGNPEAVGKNGDLGLLQVKPATAAGIAANYKEQLASIVKEHGTESHAYGYATGILTLFDQIRIVNVYAAPETDYVREKYVHLGFDESQHKDNLYVALKGYKDGIASIQKHQNSTADDGLIYPEKIATYLLFESTQHAHDSEQRQGYLDMFHRIKNDAERSGHGDEFAAKLEQAYAFHHENGDLASYNRLSLPVPKLEEMLNSTGFSADELALMQLAQQEAITVAQPLADSRRYDVAEASEPRSPSTFNAPENGVAAPRNR